MIKKWKIILSSLLVIVLVFTLLLSLPNDKNTSSPKKNISVVIDAGHGGKDVGAVGRKAQEKTINLKVALAFGKLVEEKHHIDLERVLTEKVGKLISDDDSIKYILTQDHREYGSKRVGIVLSILEETVERNYRARLEQMADELINSIDFKSKKFQKLVMEEVAKIVARKIQGGN